MEPEHNRGGRCSRFVRLDVVGGPCSLRLPRRNNATCFESKEASKVAAISSATDAAIVSLYSETTLAFLARITRRKMREKPLIPGSLFLGGFCRESRGVFDAIIGK